MARQQTQFAEPATESEANMAACIHETFHRHQHPSRKMRGFPHYIIRFLGLDGGQYGEITLVAKTPYKLEMQLGDDFVMFSREQASDLIAAMQRFLALAPSESVASDPDDAMNE